MSKMITVLIVLCGSSAFSNAFADVNSAQHPCEFIKSVCTGAGFMPKQFKTGNGLWEDCINPIMQNQTIPNAVKPMPSVDPTIVSACRTKKPKFGQGKIGNK